MSRYFKVTISLLIICALLVCTFLLNRLTLLLIYPQKYSAHVERYSEEYDVPQYVIYSVIKVESGFDKGATSERGASGLMQLMPETYKWLCEMQGVQAGDIYDVEQNIKYGTYLLSILYDRYEDLTLVMCAYNAGMGNVDKWLSDGEFEIEFPETQNYVNKIKVAQEKYLYLYY